MRILAFPIFLGIKVKEKITSYLNFKCKWSEERAKKILSYFIPRKASWNEEHKCFYFFDNGMDWGRTSNKRLLKFRDRRWWDCNCGFYGGKIRLYLIEKFELEGFEKIVNNTDDFYTNISFKMIEK